MLVGAVGKTKSIHYLAYYKALVLLFQKLRGEVMFVGYSCKLQEYEGEITIKTHKKHVARTNDGHILKQSLISTDATFTNERGNVSDSERSVYYPCHAFSDGRNFFLSATAYPLDKRPWEAHMLLDYDCFLLKNIYDKSIRRCAAAIGVGKIVSMSRRKRGQQRKTTALTT